MTFSGVDLPELRAVALVEEVDELAEQRHRDLAGAAAGASPALRQWSPSVAPLATGGVSEPASRFPRSGDSAWCPHRCWRKC
jgi:hypothetical protein